MGKEGDDDPGGPKASFLAERREVLDYVADIARELGGLLDQHGLVSLADDLRAVAIKALKAKYEGLNRSAEAPDEAGEHSKADDEPDQGKPE